MSEVDQKEEWHYYETEEGDVEALNLLTGEVAKRHVTLEEAQTHHQIQLDGQWFWLPIDRENPVVVAPDKSILFSPVMAATICRLVVGGKTLQRAATEVGISYYDLCRFRRSYPTFAIMLEQAKKDRAEYLFERIQDIEGDTDSSKEEVALKKLRVEILKHISAVGDERFSARQKVDLDATVGVKVADTGISRDRGELSPEEEEIFRRIEERQARLVSKKEEDGGE